VTTGKEGLEKNIFKRTQEEFFVEASRARKHYNNRKMNIEEKEEKNK